MATRNLVDGEDIVLVKEQNPEKWYIQIGGLMPADAPFTRYPGGHPTSPDVDECESDGDFEVEYTLDEYVQDESGSVYYRIVGGRPRGRARK